MIESIKKLFKQIYSFIKEVILDFYANNGFILTSGVVYSTLISLVPFLAVLISLFSAWSNNNEYQNIIHDFLQSSLSKDTYEQYIVVVDKFLQNTKSLGVIGVISFLFTSIFLLNRIWATFNLIFKTNLTKKTPIKQFASYLSNLVVGTLLLSTSISISTILKQFFPIVPHNTIFTSILLKVVPTIIIFIFILLMIKTIPSTKVKTVSAIIGALCGTIGWQTISFIYQNFTDIFSKYSIIYGSFAYIFIFLIWIYSLWVDIFFALEITYVHQYRMHKSIKFNKINPARIIALSIDILLIIAKNFKNKMGPTSTTKLSAMLSIPDFYVNQALAQLEKNQYIISVDTFRTKYVPATTLDNLKIEDICKTLYGQCEIESDGKKISEQIIENGIKSLKEETLNDI